MSFLKQATQLGGVGAALNPSGAAREVGGLMHISPLGIANFGNAMNGIATAGGATAGYDGSAAPVNHLQLLDPQVLRAIMEKFGPASAGTGNVDFRKVTY